MILGHLKDVHFVPKNHLQADFHLGQRWLVCLSVQYSFSSRSSVPKLLNVSWEGGYPEKTTFPSFLCSQVETCDFFLANRMWAEGLSTTTLGSWTSGGESLKGKVRSSPFFPYGTCWIADATSGLGAAIVGRKEAAARWGGRRSPAPW